MRLVINLHKNPEDINTRARPSIKMRQTIKQCLAFCLMIVRCFGFDFYNLFWCFIKQSILPNIFSIGNHMGIRLLGLPVSKACPPIMIYGHAWQDLKIHNQNRLFCQRGACSAKDIVLTINWFWPNNWFLKNQTFDFDVLTFFLYRSGPIITSKEG